jgi:hypothetical protein
VPTRPIASAAIALGETRGWLRSSRSPPRSRTRIRPRTRAREALEKIRESPVF